MLAIGSFLAMLEAKTRRKLDSSPRRSCCTPQALKRPDSKYSQSAAGVCCMCSLFLGRGRLLAVARGPVLGPVRTTGLHRKATEAEQGALVTLDGGPEGLPSVYTVQDAVLADRERVVIAFCGLSEHFAWTGGTRRLPKAEVPLFRWAYAR